MKKLYKIISLLLVFSFVLGTVNFVLADNTVTAEKEKIVVNGTTYFEAESGTAYAPMQLYKDSTVSGGYYMMPAEDASPGSSPQRNYAHLVYDITVPEDDAYYVWMRVRSNSHAKYYTCFDDGVYRKQNSFDDVAYKDEWMWVCDDKYWLTEGDHQFKIRYYSDVMQYDAFYITNDYKFTPEGGIDSIVDPNEIYTRDENGNIENLYYALPNILPPDEHPRLLFRKSDIEEIKKNLTHEQNVAAYNALLSKAAYKTDGKLPELKYGQASNINMNIALMIESNAFLYQLTGDKSYGEKAIKVARNYMESCMIDKANATSTGRTIMQAVWSTALCYDWCYDLLTEDDKEFLLFHMLYNTRYSEPSYPPVKYEAPSNSQIQGHIMEFQLLGGMMAVAVATYDEAPDYYNVVAGRIQQHLIPTVNRLNESTYYEDGSAYGMYRHYYQVLNNYIFKGMGFENVYYEEGLSLLGYLYTRQPDGEIIAEGDEYNYHKTGYIGSDNYIFFLLGNMLENSYLKTEYYRANRKDDMTTNLPGHITPAMWLIVNDVDVECDKSFRNFPLTTYTGADNAHMFARTSWDEGFDSNAVICTMNLKNRFSVGHQHKDSGHFNIYYKGLLALDSGAYEGSSFVDSDGKSVTSVGYGSPFHVGYTRQSIAHNTMLVYDPNETKTNTATNIFSTYDGGQNLPVKAPWNIYHIKDYDSDAAIVGETLSYNWGPDLQKPTYSYMKGDITKAYSDKVEEYQRSFVFFNFEDETYPAALVVFDAIRSSSPTFKKTWLLQTEEEPEIDGNTTIVTRDTIDYTGRIVNQTLMPTTGVTINKIGEDFDGINTYWVNGIKYEMKPKSETAEVGNWRVEISPKKAEKQSYFLNVLQIGDNSEYITPLQAKLVEETEVYVGVEIKDHVAYLRKDGLSKGKTFTINPSKSDAERFFAITGLAEGKWTVYDENGKQIAQEYAYKMHDSISFKAKGDKFTLKYTPVTGLVAPDYSVYGLATDDEKGIDVIIDGCYETFREEWIYKDDTVYAPLSETMMKFDIGTYTVSNTYLEVDTDTVKHKFVVGTDGVINVDGVLYAPIDLLEKVFSCKIEYNKISSIVSITYGNRERDRVKIHRYDDPDIVNIATMYAEGDLSAPTTNALDNDKATYSCIIDEGSFVAVLSEESTISKIGLFWYNGSKRNEFFDLYVSPDGENWTEVFKGQSDGVTDGFEYVDVSSTDKYKYIRIDVHNNTGGTYNSLTEIKVYRGDSK